MEKSPAFQFYVKDWLSSQRVRLSTPEQRGYYMDLLAHCWDGEGLPDDIAKLEKLADYHGPDFEQKVWKDLSQFFYKDACGKFQNERLDIEREKQKKFSKTQAKRAKHGWNTKKTKKLDVMPGASPGHARAMPESSPDLACPSDALHLQSSSAFAFANKKESLKEKEPTQSDPLNFDNNQTLKIKLAISEAMGHGFLSEANEVMYKELIDKIKKYVPKNKVENVFAYTMTAARELRKLGPQIKIKQPESVPHETF